MEDMQQQHPRSKHRWTLGFLMIVVALSALVMMLVRPFATKAPPSQEVIGLDFSFQETRTADGRTVAGLVPKMTVTKQAIAKSSPTNP